MGGKAIDKYINPFQSKLGKSFDFDMHLISNEHDIDIFGDKFATHLNNLLNSGKFINYRTYIFYILKKASYTLHRYHPFYL